MNKKIVTLVIALFSVNCVVFSQKTTDSPYSYYGIGAFNSIATTEESLMGGVGVYADSTRVNLQNPATLSRLQFTAFSGGLSFGSKRIASEQTKVSGKSTTTDYLYLGFPILDKLGVAAGILPLSSVGYKLASTTTVDGSTHLNQFEGEGNVNRFFASAGYEVYKGLSLGASFKFDFGRIQMTDWLTVSGVQFQTQEYSLSTLRGTSVEFGLYYRKNLQNKLELATSLVYIPEHRITSKNERSISTLGTVGVTSTQGTTSYVTGEIEKQTEDLGALKETKITMPTQIQMGVGIGEKQKWFAGFGYTYSNTERFANPFLSTTHVVYENGYKFSLGGFYIPQHNSISSYWKRVTYRAGIKYERTGIVLNNQSINDFGISFGLSLPVRGFSNITTGFEYGKIGTVKQGLIRENYFNLKIGFTLNDKWFQKTKYQ